MGAPLAGVAPIFALSFFGNDLGKTLIRGATGSSELNAFQLAMAGGFSGILTTAIMAPGERIKCILQVRTTSFFNNLDFFKESDLLDFLKVLKS